MMGLKIVHNTTLLQ